MSSAPAQLQLTLAGLGLSGSWTAVGLGTLGARLDSARPAVAGPCAVDASGVEALDTAGAWALQMLLLRLRQDGRVVTLRGLPAAFTPLFDAVAAHLAQRDRALAPPPPGRPNPLQTLGQGLVAAVEEIVAALAFVGEGAVTLAGCLARPSRLRVRPILFNIRTAGFDALPIVGLLSFLLGVVVGYQSADMLRQYGANVFIADVIGVSMLREFAPLITAIIVAGRSGSAYAAQIGAMVVSEEVDAMRTIGIAPMEMLVLPKVVALVIALPLVTVFADLLGVCGGMVMAQSQLGVGYGEFLDRFLKAVSTTSYLVGIGKAPVFAFIIACVGCFQGFRTRGGADSVGRQTTRSVVQSIFLVIVADGLFSVVFSALDL